VTTLGRSIICVLFFSAEEFAVETNVVSIKEAWKGVVAPLLAKRLGRSLNSGVDCKFFVNINFEYPAEDMEVACM